MELQFNNPDFWASLHGTVPGLLDWDLGNECFLPFTTSQLSTTEQNLALYKLRVVKPPKLPLEKNANADEDGPDIEPNMWMWVDPNVVYPPGKLEVSESVTGEEMMSTVSSSAQPTLKEEDSDNCSEVTVTESPPPSSTEQSPPQKQCDFSPTYCELTEDEEAEDQDDSSSVACLSPHKKAPLQNQRLQHTSSPEGNLWSRPPLNYFHLIALALRNSSPCGLNVQQIYSFTRQHFPFFRTAPEGWKNTIRHNLCFRDSFEKVPVNMQGGGSARPQSCLWKLTEKGHRRFLEETRTLASTRLDSISQCMSQPDLMPFLFDL